MIRGAFGRMGWLIFVEVVMLVAYFAAPALHAASIHQQAAGAAREIERVCTAAVAAHARTGTWPEDGAPGRAPESMKAFLPPGFSFGRKAYQIDWDHWRLSDGPESSSRRSKFLGVSVTAQDPRVCAAIVEALGDERPYLDVGDRVMFVISDSGTSTR